MCREQPRLLFRGEADRVSYPEDSNFVEWLRAFQELAAKLKENGFNQARGKIAVNNW
jgi:hypothetical protein